MPRDLPVQLCHVSKLISDSDTVKLPRWCIQRLGIREGDPIVAQLQPDVQQLKLYQPALVSLICLTPRYLNTKPEIRKALRRYKIINNNQLISLLCEDEAVYNFTLQCKPTNVNFWLNSDNLRIELIISSEMERIAALELIHFEAQKVNNDSEAIIKQRCFDLEYLQQMETETQLRVQMLSSQLKNLPKSIPKLQLKDSKANPKEIIPYSSSSQTSQAEVIIEEINGQGPTRVATPNNELVHEHHPITSQSMPI